MFSTLVFAVLLVPALVVAQGTSTTTAAAPPTGVPSTCISTCWITITGAPSSASGCGPFVHSLPPFLTIVDFSISEVDFPCICDEPGNIAAIESCITSTCPGEITSFRSSLTSACPGIVGLYPFPSYAPRAAISSAFHPRYDALAHHRRVHYEECYGSRKPHPDHDEHEHVHHAFASIIRRTFSYNVFPCIPLNICICTQTKRGCYRRGDYGRGDCDLCVRRPVLPSSKAQSSSAGSHRPTDRNVWFPRAFWMNDQPHRLGNPTHPPQAIPAPQLTRPSSSPSASNFFLLTYACSQHLFRHGDGVEFCAILPSDRRSGRGIFRAIEIFRSHRRNIQFRCAGA